MSMISIDDQIACIEREIAMRRRCYPRWVKEGRMSEDKAAHEMNAIVEVLRTLGEVRRQSLSVKSS